MSELSNIIRKGLKDKGMNVSTLAKATGLKPRTIYNVIHGQSRKASPIRAISEIGRAHV